MTRVAALFRNQSASVKANTVANIVKAFFPVEKPRHYVLDLARNILQSLRLDKGVTDWFANAEHAKAFELVL